MFIFPRQLHAFIKRPFLGRQKGKVLAEMVDIGARVADDKKQRVSYIIISMNKVLRLLIIRSHSNPYFLWGYFRIKTLANLRLFLMYANKIVKNVEFNRKLIYLWYCCYFVFLLVGNTKGQKCVGKSSIKRQCFNGEVNKKING